MSIIQIKKEQSHFETLIVRLLKMENRLQFSMDEEWDYHTSDFLASFVELKESIENEYGDSFPYLLGLRQQESED